MRTVILMATSRTINFIRRALNIIHFIMLRYDKRIRKVRQQGVRTNIYMTQQKTTNFILN